MKLANLVFYWYGDGTPPVPPNTPVLDLVGEYSLALGVTGEYRTAVDAVGEFEPVLDLVGEVD